MAPPKVSPTSTSATADGSGFFQRGKKPTTTQRTIAGKQSPVKKQQQQSFPLSPKNERDNNNTNNLKRPAKSDEGDDTENAPPPTPLSSEQQPEDDWGGLNTEIFEDHSTFDTWGVGEVVEVVEIEPSTTTTPATNSNNKKSTSILPKELTDFKARRRSVESSKKSKLRTYIPNGIHQSGLSKEEKLLRQFDLSPKYGPCIDLTRLERWERASQLGLEPPQDIRDLVTNNMALNTPVFAGRV